jgi:uncharacterized protein YkwD
MMKFLLLILLLVLSLGCEDQIKKDSTPVRVIDSVESQEAFLNDLAMSINSHRSRFSLSALSRLTELDRLAQMHAEDLANGRISDEVADRDARCQLAREVVPERSGQCAEVTAQGFESIALLMQYWLNVFTARSQLESVQAHSMGLGVHRSSHGQLFWSVLLVRP